MASDWRCHLIGDLPADYVASRVNVRDAGPQVLVHRDCTRRIKAYTGAFGVYVAKRNGAHVTNLDASANSLDLARQNFELNDVPEDIEYVAADAFHQLP